jgi:hypothetical protein
MSRERNPDNTKEQIMAQRQFALELRVDYADNGKNAEMKKAVLRAGRHLLATAELLADGIKPEIVAYADDFFEGHTEISILEDIIGNELAEEQRASETPDGAAAGAFSAELTAAVRR